MIGRKGLSALTILIVVCAFAIPAAAQLTTGTVSGSVKDAQGAIVPGATVALISATRGTTIDTQTTNAQGEFVFPNIAQTSWALGVGGWEFALRGHQ